MRRPPGGDPSDEDDTLMMGWAPGSELPRFDISATGMRRVTPEASDPEIEIEELDDEPTLIHDRPGSQPPPEPKFVVRPATPVPPPPVPRTPLPPPSRNPVPVPRTPPPRRVESDSSQFAVSAHAFAIAQHQARQAPPHVKPLFGERDASSPAPQPLVAPLPPPPPDLVAFEPVVARPVIPVAAPLAPEPPVVFHRPPIPPPPSRPSPPLKSTPPPPPVADALPSALGDDEEPGSSRSFYARTQRLPRPDETDERPAVQPPRIVPSVIVQPRRARRTASPFAGRTGTLLGAASLLLSVALGVWLLRPHKGELRIAVFAPRGAVDRAEIFVDGEKKCDTAPCVVTDLGPGPRAVQVIAAGYAPTSVTEVVEPGKQRLALVSLGATGSTPTDAPVPTGATPVSAAVGELSASGPSTVHAFVDGVDRGPLPLKMHDLPAGSHRVRFEGGPRYEAVERTVEVAGGRSLDLGTVKLRLLKASARVDVADTGARVTIEQGGSEHLLKGPWPMTVEIDATRPARLLAKKRGFKDFELPLSFDEGQTEKSFKVELEPVGSSAAAVAWSGSRGRERPAPSRERPAPPEQDKSDKSDDAPAAEKAPSGGTGTLNINSLPASRVLVDGSPVGSTPKVDYQVSAGTHTITFVHPDLGKKSVTVTVKAGQSSVAAVRFKAPSDE